MMLVIILCIVNHCILLLHVSTSITFHTNKLRENKTIMTELIEIDLDTVCILVLNSIIMLLNQILQALSHSFIDFLLSTEQRNISIIFGPQAAQFQGVRVLTSL